ncbi:FitA-like ribbon-helix-helix domain-containing protein [Aurantimonas coralicida]|uniref:FitA-like ribbon-helix-helix domain-containing protein n=1 Tax=Aurantimonas coralicida TaxID=182270 RepID=UPI001E3BF099|nr:hypothetical protein [Aurantimonas coralicida]MCD1642164.1 hypothetical protein [Aurantimonas coralicida]
MAQITVRKLDDDVLDALKARARANKRSTEAEIRDILKRATDAPEPAERVSLWALAGSAPSSRTVEEIVEDVRKLRDDWER